ncbi:MAG: hypothetical protein ACJAZ3_001030 [Sphingobacteriales bacterium]|jgi:hypothetical protein
MRVSLFIFILITICSCKPTDNLSDIPRIFDSSEIKNTGNTGKDSLILLNFSFEDGDANIGLKENENTPPFNINLFVEYFEKSDGELKKVTITDSDGKIDTVDFNGRIPFLNKDGNLVSVTGEIEHKVNVAFAGSDTIQFRYYIVDRLQNTSNKITTEEIILIR